MHKIPDILYLEKIHHISLNKKVLSEQPRSSYPAPGYTKIGSSCIKSILHSPLKKASVDGIIYTTRGHGQ